MSEQELTHRGLDQKIFEQRLVKIQRHRSANGHHEVLAELERWRADFIGTGIAFPFRYLFWGIDACQAMGRYEDAAQYAYDAIALIDQAAPTQELTIYREEFGARLAGLQRLAQQHVDWMRDESQDVAKVKVVADISRRMRRKFALLTLSKLHLQSITQAARQVSSEANVPQGSERFYELFDIVLIFSALTLSKLDTDGAHAFAQMDHAIPNDYDAIITRHQDAFESLAGNLQKLFSAILIESIPQE